MRHLALSLGALTLVACVDLVDVGETEQTIIGGTQASTTEFPSIVGLDRGQAGNWFCTGVLIDKDWVLTTASCFSGEQTVRARFDDNNIADNGGGKVVNVSEIHLNPNFNFNNATWASDVALLKLSQSVTDRTPTPILRTPLAVGTMTTIAGYGANNNNGNGGGVLRKLSSPTLDCSQTNNAGISGANVLCYNAADGNAGCMGDGGAPAYVTIGGKTFVAGIDSGGTEMTCTAGFDIFTETSAELTFIDQFVPKGMDPPSDPTNPTDPMNPTDPVNPTHPEQDPTANNDSVGGCSAGGGNAGLLLGLAGLAMLRRRRR